MPSPSVSASALRVLIVDDEATMRTFMRRVLQHLGVTRVEEARDGAEALAIARARDVDLIISDYDMPRMDGLALAAALREDPRFARVGFILISGVVGVAVVSKAAELGVHSFLRKPFSAHDLQQRIDAVLSRLTAAADWRAFG